MTTAAASRGRRTSPATMAAIVTGVLAFHASVLVSVDVDSMIANRGLGAKGKTKPLAEPEDLKVSCMGDAILASSMRYSLCFAPWQNSPDTCLVNAELDMRIDFSACQAQQSPDAIASIAMLEPRAADKVTPID